MRKYCTPLQNNGKPTMLSNIHRQHNFMFLVFMKGTGLGPYFEHHSGPFT